jgi:two-component system, OmpR family, sensor histidine kinase MtrB
MTDSAMTPAANEILSTLPETIVQVDHDWAIAHVNRPESPVFVRKASPGDRLDEVISPEAAETVIGLIDNAQRTGGALAEYHAGSDLYRVTARPLSSAPLTVLVFKNITGIRSAGQTIVDLVRERSTFLAAVSNELHTPLAAVVGYANLLSDSDAALDDDTRAAMVKHMTDQAWDLAGIVEDLLTVAHAELGELHMAKVQVHLGANVAQVLESMGHRSTGVTVLESGEVYGTGDPARYRQVIRNLLSNALRHGGEPVTIEITHDVGEAVLLVRDAGEGLSDELSRLITEQSTSGYSSSPGSLGLGLWICHELTRLMGGSLDYYRINGETVFKVAIPMI